MINEIQPKENVKILSNAPLMKYIFKLTKLRVRGSLIKNAIVGDNSMPSRGKTNPQGTQGEGTVIIYLSRPTVV